MQAQTTYTILTGFLLLLAGCADDAPAAKAEAPLSGQFDEDLGGSVVNATSTNATLGMDTPIVLRGASGPATPLTSFEYKIPEGAIIEWRPIPNFDFVVEMLNFEFVPVVPTGIEIQDFALAAFDEDGSLLALRTGTPIHSQSRTGPIVSGQQTYAFPLEPGTFTLFAGGLEAGDTLHFVVAAKSAEPAALSFLLAPSDERLSFNDAPDDAQDLLDGRTAVNVPVNGRGEGLQLALYLNLNVNFATIFLNIEQWTDSVTIDDRLDRATEPVATVRDVQVSARYDQAGYSMGAVQYFGSSTASLGMHDIQMDLHGTAVSHRNLILDTAVPLASTYILTGLPIAFAIGDGEGAASSVLDLQVASVNDFEIILLEQIDFGTRLNDLIGVDALVGGAAFSGLLGDIPPSYLWVEGDDLVLFSGGSIRHIVDAGTGVKEAFAQRAAHMS